MQHVSASYGKDLDLHEIVVRIQEPESWNPAEGGRKQHFFSRPDKTRTDTGKRWRQSMNDRRRGRARKAISSREEITGGDLEEQLS